MRVRVVPEKPLGLIKLGTALRFRGNPKVFCCDLWGRLTRVPSTPTTYLLNPIGRLLKCATGSTLAASGIRQVAVWWKDKRRIQTIPVVKLDRVPENAELVDQPYHT